MRSIAFSLSLTLSSLACGGSAGPVAAEIERTGPGKVTVVEFVDYDCVHCRDLHATFAPLLAEQEGAVRVVLKHVPLERHATARRAAYAAICAEPQDKSYAMHDALMTASSRSEDDLLNIAQHVGLDVERFKECLRSDLPETRLREDLDAYHAVGGDGLPMVFIQTTKLVGTQPESTLADALRSAATR